MNYLIFILKFIDALLNNLTLQKTAIMYTFNTSANISEKDSTVSFNLTRKIPFGKYQVLLVVERKPKKKHKKYGFRTTTKLLIVH